MHSETLAHLRNERWHKPILHIIPLPGYRNTVNASPVSHGFSDVHAVGAKVRASRQFSLLPYRNRSPSTFVGLRYHPQNTKVVAITFDERSSVIIGVLVQQKLSIKSFIKAEKYAPCPRIKGFLVIARQSIRRHSAALVSNSADRKSTVHAG